MSEKLSDRARQAAQRARRIVLDCWNTEEPQCPPCERNIGHLITAFAEAETLTLRQERDAKVSQLDEAYALVGKEKKAREAAESSLSDLKEVLKLVLEDCNDDEDGQLSILPSTFCKIKTTLAATPQSQQCSLHPLPSHGELYTKLP
jgi:hypothetical protein